jgi:hypothetical protein
MCCHMYVVMGGSELASCTMLHFRYEVSCYECLHVFEQRSLVLSELLRIPLGFTGPKGPSNLEKLRFSPDPSGLPTLQAKVMHQ